MSNHGRATLTLDRIRKGSYRNATASALASDLSWSSVFRAGLRVFDGDFYHEFSATDILLGPGDLCSHVILVERRHFDVHAFLPQSLSSNVRSYTTVARTRLLLKCTPSLGTT